MANLLYHEQQVPDVQWDVSAEVGVEGQIAHGAFPYSVDVDAYQFAVAIEYRTAWVTSRGVVGGEEAYWLVVMTSFGIDVTQGLRNVIVEDLWIVLFNDFSIMRNVIKIIDF